jgi:rubredoxin
MEKITWKCTNCGYTYEKEAPAEECPSCNSKCEMVNVTCYIPECEGAESDPRLGTPKK